MSAVPDNSRHGEAVQAARYARRHRPAPLMETASGSAQIASVVMPFLAREKDRLPARNFRLDFGGRKFDVATGESWSVYFRVVNTKSHKASHYYIVDLSSRLPLVILADSLDVGSAVRRREAWSEKLVSHGDVTEQVLTKLLDRAVDEADER